MVILILFGSTLNLYFAVFGRLRLKTARYCRESKDSKCRPSHLIDFAAHNSENRASARTKDERKQNYPDTNAMRLHVVLYRLAYRNICLLRSFMLTSISGENDRFDYDLYEQRFTISEIQYARNYNNTTTTQVSDVALLKLNKRVIYESTVQTVCLPNVHDKYYRRVDKAVTCYLTGTMFNLSTIMSS